MMLSLAIDAYAADITPYVNVTYVTNTYTHATLYTSCRCLLYAAALR